MSSLARLLRELENALLTVLAVALILLAATQIGLRNLDGPSLPWMDPLIRSLVLWLGLLGALVATREGRHIRIDLLPRLLPERSRLWLARAVALCSAGLCGLLAWQSVRLVADERAFGAIGFLGVPLWVLQLSLPIVFGLMALRFLAQVLQPPVAQGSDRP